MIQLYFYMLAMNMQISKFKNIIPFTIIEKMKYLDVNLTKHAWGLHAENYKTLMKESKS